MLFLIETLILEKLLHKELQSIDKLCSEFGIPKNKITYYIGLLNKDILSIYNVEILRLFETYLYLNICDENIKQKIKRKILSISRFNKESRKEYILFYISINYDVKISNIVNQLGISRNTIRSDVKELEKEYDFDKRNLNSMLWNYKLHTKLDETRNYFMMKYVEWTINNYNFFITNLVTNAINEVLRVNNNSIILENTISILKMTESTFNYNKFKQLLFLIYSSILDKRVNMIKDQNGTRYRSKDDLILFMIKNILKNIEKSEGMYFKLNEVTKIDKYIKEDNKIINNKEEQYLLKNLMTKINNEFSNQYEYQVSEKNVGFVEYRNQIDNILFVNDVNDELYEVIKNKIIDKYSITRFVSSNLMDLYNKILKYGNLISYIIVITYEDEIFEITDESADIILINPRHFEDDIRCLNIFKMGEYFNVAEEK